MTLSPIAVRPLTSDAELDLHCQAADQAFSSNPSPENARRWKQVLTAQPGYRPETIRGVFRDGEQMGSYIIYERLLRMGEAQIATGCIGAVVTYPAYRKAGVATALMLDAIDYAQSHNYSLLLLDGIPKFYYRYGYIDMFDVSAQDIDYSAILAFPASPYTVRPATPDDAEAMLALYDRHCGPYTGSFVRSLETQRFRIQNRSSENPHWLALDPSGVVRGYLTIGFGAPGSQAQEMAADDWSAMVALLQHHARLLEGPEKPAFLTYRLPPTGSALQSLIDGLEVPDTSHWDHPSMEWGVRGHTYHHRFAGWMSRLIRLSTLAHSLLPEWQARWQRSLVSWSGDIQLLVGEEMCTLRIDGDELSLIAGPGIASDTVQLTPQQFIQVLFGYRPIATFLRHSEQPAPADLLTVLNVLFPMGHTWIPASDWF